MWRLLEIIWRGVWLLSLPVAENAIPVTQLSTRAPHAEEGIPAYPEYGMCRSGWKGTCNPA